MPLTNAMISQIVTFLSKIQYLEIQMKEVPYVVPTLNQTLESQIDSKRMEIEQAIQTASKNSYSREQYESTVYPLKLQLYDLRRQNELIIENNRVLLNTAQNDQQALISPIQVKLNTIQDNFVQYLKSIKTELQN